MVVGALGLAYSPFASLLAVATRKLFQILYLIGFEIFGKERSFSCKNCCCFIAYSLIFPIILFLIQFILTFCASLLVFAVCLIGGLSCRFIIRMFGFIIMGLVLNAEIASPFVTFVIVAARNLHLCYFNMQERYKEVKQIISKQWQKHKNLLFDKTLSNSEARTIPGDLFWHVCDDESKSKHTVLPVRSEIFRMLGIMALILIFLFLSLCSVILLRNTY